MTKILTGILCLFLVACSEGSSSPNEALPATKPLAEDGTSDSSIAVEGHSSDEIPPGAEDFPHQGFGASPAEAEVYARLDDVSKKRVQKVNALRMHLHEKKIKGSKECQEQRLALDNDLDLLLEHVVSAETSSIDEDLDAFQLKVHALRFGDCAFERPATQ